MIIVEQRPFHKIADEEKTLLMFHEGEKNIITPLKKIIRGHHDEAIEQAEFVAGSVTFVEAALKRIGKKPLQETTYPKSGEPYYKRKMRVGKKRDLENVKLPVFIKPYSNTKAFTGFVVHDLTDYRLNWVNNQNLIWICEAVEFISETRFYLASNGDCYPAHYSGNPDVNFNNKVVGDIIMAVDKELGRPQVIDIGATPSGFCLVEVNEPYAVGHYHSVSAAVYHNIIKFHWQRMTK